MLKSGVTFVLLLMLAGCGSGPLVPPSANQNAAATSPRTPTYSVIYRFNEKGGGGPGGLTFVKHRLYGVAGFGKSNRCIGGCGVAFELSKSGNERLLHTFGSSPNDGVFPSGEMISLGGTLYGTTSAATSPCLGACYGTIFRITAAGSYRVLYRFKGGSDGSSPSGRLLNVGGVFYGTTLEGGGTGCADGRGCGTVFSVTASGAETVLYRFQGNGDAANPMAGLTYAGGAFYGTTYGGGILGYGNQGCYVTGCGTVFKLTPSGSSYAETVVYRFTGKTDGATPSSGLALFAGALFGTTNTGGRGWFYGGACGVLYRVDATDAVTVVHEFSKGRRGCHPYGEMATIGDVLYGTTAYGGVGAGTIFAYDVGGTFETLYSLAGGSDGYTPVTGVIAAGGSLYGTTYFGGNAGCFEGAVNGCGTVFEIKP